MSISMSIDSNRGKNLTQKDEVSEISIGIVDSRLSIQPLLAQILVSQGNKARLIIKILEKPSNIYVQELS